MKATVISVQKNITKQGKNGSYKVHLFKYQPDDYDGHSKAPIERPIFVSNQNYPDLPDKVAALNANDYIELTFVKNGDYSNVSDVVVLGQAPPKQEQAPPAPKATPANNDAYMNEQLRKEARYDAQEVRKQLAIGKQTCLKAAIEVVTTLLARSDYYIKKIKQETIMEEVQAFANNFEAHLQGSVKVTGGIDFKAKLKETNNSEQPPFNPDDDIPF